MLQVYYEGVGTTEVGCTDTFSLIIVFARCPYIRSISSIGLDAVAFL